MLRELHLFAGVGGGILGGELLGHRCVGAVELDPYCRRVLGARQADGTLPPFPIHSDVHTFDGRPWRDQVDVVCGGFPCQPFSSAGKRLGTADPRHLWPEMARVIGECRPRFVFAENVSLGAFREPWRDLRGLGYRVPPALCLSAADLGAPHRRNRWWLLAVDADRIGKGAERSVHGGSLTEPAGVGDAADADRHSEHAVAVDAEASSAQEPTPADADRSRLAIGQGQRGDACSQLTSAVRGDRWSVGARVRRVAHGIPSRVDRLRALGNAQVPICAATAFRILQQRLA